jgi:hypothetical protein
MTVVAGAFLILFGGAASWLLATRFPKATFTRIGYAMMTVGGVLALVWAIAGTLAFGVAAVVILAFGGLIGIVGALRKELRFDIPA